MTAVLAGGVYVSGRVLWVELCVPAPQIYMLKF